MIVRFRGIEKKIENNFTGKTGIYFLKNVFPEMLGKVVCMSFNGKLFSLNHKLNKSIEYLEFYDVRNAMGAKTIGVSTIAVMLCSADQIFPEHTFSVEHSLNGGFYCEPNNGGKLPDDYINIIEDKMLEVVHSGYTISNKLMSVESVDIFEHGRFKFAQTLKNKTINISFICKDPHWFIAPLVPNTSYVKVFRLQPYGKGFVVQFPNADHPDRLPEVSESKKIYDVFQESKQRSSLLNIRFTDHLNTLVQNENYVEAIQVYEALHEKKITSIADMIVERGDKVKFVFIAGPSSSGKTSFMKRLKIQLRLNGLNSKTISLDDYFIDRGKIPFDTDGQQDFEHINTVDSRLLKKHLHKLLDGESVKLSHYEFKEGKQLFADEATILDKNELLILEGIHGLNPMLTEGLPSDTVFKIYISALTNLNFNLYNRVSTADTRLLRRMLRDYKYRGYSIENTLTRWGSVRAGEEKWIFPFQETADAIFNSSLEYEWAVFKPLLYSKLAKVPLDSPVKTNAMRLKNLLELFLPIPIKYIPPTSLLREFLGGSSFNY